MKTRFVHYLKESLRCALGALMVLSLLQPFGIDNQHNRLLFLMGETVWIFGCCLLVYLLLDCFPFYRKRINSLCTTDFAWMFFVHYLLFVPFLSACLCLYNMWFEGYPLVWAWRAEDGSFSLRNYFLMCLWVSIIGLFILIWQLYRFRARRLEQELVDVKAINALLEARQMQLAEAAEQPEQPTRTPISIKGNAQNARLELCPEDIIYIESMANYADIVFIEEATTRHATLRITLKQLKEQLAQADYLVQCHRAFLVNLNFIRNLSVRSAGSYELELFGLDKRIPVSRANADTMRNLLER